MFFMESSNGTCKVFDINHKEVIPLDLVIFLVRHQTSLKIDNSI